MLSTHQFTSVVSNTGEQAAHSVAVSLQGTSTSPLLSLIPAIALVASELEQKPVYALLLSIANISAAVLMTDKSAFIAASFALFLALPKDTKTIPAKIPE